MTKKIPYLTMKSEASTTNWVMPGNSAPMASNILAKVGTTNQSMAVTANTATLIRMIGYISAPETLRWVSRVSRICLLSSSRTKAIFPVISPVRITSTQWRWKMFWCSAAAACSELPADTRPAISSSDSRILTLWLCSAPISIDCKSGVPDETSVANWWKKVILSSKPTPLCGLLETLARAMNQSSHAMSAHLPPLV